MSLEEDILKEARELGFAAAGIAAAGPSVSFSTFQSWLDAGYAADMEFLKRTTAVREDVRRLAPAVKSVVCVAARYPVNPRPGTGFSTYARGLDYHDVMRARLDRLGQFVKSVSGAVLCRVCVDSAPLLEREWAVRSGIGWLGKQGQIVNARLGCCLVLGELLVDIALAPTPPAVNRCGRCRRCLDACPTRAMGGAGRLDAHRCIAYLTVEHKGPFPHDLASAQGRALFGCDFCTAVCPWNRFGDDKILPELAAGDRPDAETCLRLSENDFERVFKQTAVFRTGLERLQRNARTALANRVNARG